MRTLIRSCLIADPRDKPLDIYQNFLALRERKLEFEQIEDTVIWTFIMEFAREHGHCPDIGTIQMHFGPECLAETTVVDRARVLQSTRAVTKGDFLTHLRDRVALHNAKETVNTLKTAATIITTETEVGSWPNKRKLRGWEDALSYAAEESRAIQRRAHPETASDLGALLLKVVDSHDRAALGEHAGLRLGSDLIDDSTDGIQPGAVWFLGGFAKHGKSTFTLNAAYHQVVNCGHDVAYITTEMPAEQVTRFFLALHQYHPRFQEMRESMEIPADFKFSNDDVLCGRLADAYRKYMCEVCNDLYNRQGGDYGHLLIAGPAGDRTVAAVFGQVEAWGTDGHDPRLLVMDYPQMLKSARETASDTQNLRGVVNDLKLGAVEFGRGRGIACLAPWQISRDGKAEAIKRRKATPAHVYDAAALSWTSEVERAADLVMAVWSDDELKARGKQHVECILSRERDFPSAEYPIDWSTRKIHLDRPSDDVPPGSVPPVQADVDAAIDDAFDIDKVEV